MLFPPAQGAILQKYNVANKHLAVKIALTNNTQLKPLQPELLFF